MGKPVLKADLTPSPLHGPPPLAARFTPASQFHWIGSVELLAADQVFIVQTYRSTNPIQFDRMCRELADYTLAHKPHVDLVLFQV